MRRELFSEGEFYHIYNRGVDKRNIFSDQVDADRFFQGMQEFNRIEPIGSIYENSFLKNKKNQLGHSMSKLVDFVAYNLLSNHYHFILSPKVEGGVEKFMQRLSNGYTKYFNNKHKRSGTLFQGRYKVKHIDSDEYLLHVSAYVNLNDRIKELGHSMSKLHLYSSWREYVEETSQNFCEKGIILERFKNISEYKEFAEDSFLDIQNRKMEEKELADLLIE